jgi:hypothetical protein
MSFSNFNRFNNPVEQYLDGSGVPYANAKLNFYATGTLNRKNTYSNSALTVLNDNPVQANANGYFGNIFMSATGDYHVVLTDENDVQIFDADPVSGTQLYGLLASVAQLNSTDTSCLNKSTDYTVQASDWGKTILMDASGGERSITLLPAVTVGNGWRINTDKIDSTSNQVKILADDIDGQTQYILATQYAGISIVSNGDKYFIQTTDGVTTIDPVNLLTDGQFTFGIPQGSTLPADEPVQIGQTGWVFEKDGSGGTDSLTFPAFPLGDDTIPRTPINMLHYSSTVVAVGETYKRFYLPIEFVRSLEQQTITISIVAKGGTTLNAILFYEQFFGTGGSPSATNTVEIETFELTTDFIRYSATIKLDSLAEMVLGSNGDDELRIGIMLPINAVLDFYCTNFLMTFGTILYDYPYLTPEEVAPFVPPITNVEVADNVSAGNYYVDTATIANSVYIATTPHNPQFSNPSQLYSGATIKFVPEYTNTGPSTLTFLGETLPIVNALGGADPIPLSPGQIIGNSLQYSVGWELQFNTDNLGVRQWFLTHVPTSYTPVVIQKIAIPTSVNFTTTNQVEVFSVDFVPKSISSQIIVSCDFLAAYNTLITGSQYTSIGMYILANASVISTALLSNGASTPADSGEKIVDTLSGKALIQNTTGAAITISANLVSTVIGSTVGINLPAAAPSQSLLTIEEILN